MSIRPTALRRRSAHSVAAFLFLACFFSSACKTSDDAAAAATQLTATAQSLTNYYSALDTILANTDQLNSVQVVLYGIPYDDAAKAQIADARTEIQKRAAVAKSLTNLAQNFAKLTGSSAATDASASAGKLEDEVKTLGASKTFASSSPEMAVLNDALGAIVKAIQEKKERDAAKSMSKFAQGLDELFAKEAPVYESLNTQYVAISSSLAVTMLTKGQTDPTGFFTVALNPYALTPEVTDPALKDGFAKIAVSKVEEKAAVLKNSQKDATESMEQSLKQMAGRIDLVANDKPMQASTAPLTLANVEKWASQFTSSTPAASPAKAATTSTATRAN
jgi:cell fate (sporulation/competence/biofilm development) regulator YmcA (YheA/YmcA/DUF963 family)